MNELKTDKLLLSSKEACSYLGINRNLLDSYRRAGIIRASKLSRQYYYSRKELESFVDRNIGKEITKDGLILGESSFIGERS